jgi:GDP-L-fucose synthase
MPPNLYGPGDNYHPTHSPVLPALIRRFHKAAQGPDQGAGTTVTCWGTGLPLREFLHVDDLGEACAFALEHLQPGPQELQFLNVGTGVDLSIRDLADQVAIATGIRGAIEWDASNPVSTPKKQLDVSRLAALGWRARIPLADGLASTIAEFSKQLNAHLVRL